MGNCLASDAKKSTAEIAPFDFIKPAAAATASSALTASSAAAAAAPAPPPTQCSVRLFGSPHSSSTAYVRFALLYKSASVHFIPSDTEPLLQIGSDSIWGTREMLLGFLEGKLPHPPALVVGKNEGLLGETAPLVVRAVVLQHRSMVWHLQRMVRWGQDLAARGGKKPVDPAMGTPRMEIRKFGKSYSQLLELMLEHAQMEERVVFPLLEMADRGLCKAVNEEHAGSLPIMNGIKEDIKSIGVLDTGSHSYQDALGNLSTRLNSLQKHCKEHFEEEERDILPLVEAVELGKEQQLKVLQQCFDMMQGTHSHLFNFIIEGLLPREAVLYADLIIRSKTEEQALAMLRRFYD